MKLKIIGLSASTLLFVGTLSGGVMVKADDDHEYEEHERGEHYEKYGDDDDRYKYEYEEEEEYEYDDDDEYEYDSYTYPTASEQETWNIWTRTIMVQKGNLPFNESKNVTLQLENDTNRLSFYAIPRDGEIFIPGRVIAEMLGAEATVYDASQILEITTDNQEIIFRANTNVAFDNGQKTPLPSVAFSLNNDIYIPISVIANGLGFLVEWQADNNCFICRPLNN
ncbi:copper amine oxidase-like protein [Ureibacillus xyleni]|uniref:Copper amine oxidase-like protein n=1 Tax=Ureibacillus xyleni TaxID=614648 RepID=A0A285TJN8_9BACL|nr:copper amine oxidase N-terminal domain-containing protein [Ureibacillus xyleni]SOC22452.1 copper amine oxidase-like protein [Ureibacillus xyleni]